MIDTDKQIAAAEAHAANYDGDVREGIKTDVLNAFYAGVKFAIEEWSNGSEPVAYRYRFAGMYDDVWLWDTPRWQQQDPVEVVPVFARPQPAIQPGWQPK